MMEVSLIESQERNPNTKIKSKLLTFYLTGRPPILLSKGERCTRGHGPSHTPRRRGSGRENDAMMTRGLRIRECPEAVRDYDIKMTDTHVELDHYSTPDCWHYKQYKDVYEPSEDSFLFLDALEQDQVSLKERK